MQIENYQWLTRLRVDRPVAGFPEPLGVAESEAVAPVYRLSGARRTQERDCAVFQYTQAGEGRFQAGGREFAVGPGSGFLCHVGDPGIAYYYPEDGRVPWRFMFFTFRDPGGLVHGLTSVHGHVYRLAAGAPLLRRLVAFRASANTVAEIRAGEGALLVQNLLSTLADGAGVADGGQTGELVRRCRGKVDELLFDPCNAAILAAALGVSAEHLSRVFHRETGETLYHFLLRRKLDQACVMLKEPGASCQEVARAMGFVPGSHFARVFKRFMGMTPGEFRGRGLPGACRQAGH